MLPNQKISYEEENIFPFLIPSVYDWKYYKTVYLTNACSNICSVIGLDKDSLTIYEIRSLFFIHWSTKIFFCLCLVNVLIESLKSFFCFDENWLIYDWSWILHLNWKWLIVQTFCRPTWCVQNLFVWHYFAKDF